MADLRHERDTNARSPRRPVLVAVPLAVAATASAVTLGIVTHDPGSTDPAAATRARVASAAADRTTQTPAPSAAATRAPVVSRSETRPRATGIVKTPNLTSKVVTRKAIRAAKAADTHLWVTDELNLWTKPGKNADHDGELESDRQVLVTGRGIWGRSEVVYQGRSYWVTDGYLSTDKPVGAGAGLSDAPCPATSAVESGLTDGAVAVHRAICNAFPQITTYGGRDNHGEHVTGKAIDAMTSDVELGTAIAEFLRAHAAELNIYDIIWRQRIFTQERGGEGWRGMPSRGSATADHYDHVHVSVY